MSYIVKLCYLPLLTDPTFLFTQPLSISSELVDNGVKANNISFINDELMVTVDDTLNGTVNSNLFKSNYNCLLLYNDNVDYIEVYKVTSINFIGGKQVRVKARLTNYSIDKKEVVDNETTYLLTNRTELRSKCGFVKYGYAYDSILKLDGTLNLDGVGGTDIYKGDRLECSILNYRKKMNFRCIFDDVNTPNDSISNSFNECFNAWLYIYCEPREYKTVDDVAYNIPRVTISGVTQSPNMTLPYGVIVAPLTKTGKPMLIDNGSFNYSHFIEVYSPYIYSVKVSGKPPFKLLTSQIESFNNGYKIKTNDGVLTNSFNSIEQTNGVCYLTKTDLQPFETTPLLYSDLYPYYPRGFNKQTVSKQEFENFKYNPYIKSLGTNVRISDSVGGTKDFNPIELGFINDGIVLQYYEALTPDITKIYITPKIANLEMSLLKENVDKTYIGSVNEVDLSLPYSQDQLVTFLANNKNFFQQKFSMAFLTGMGDSLRSFLTYIGGNKIGGISKQTQAIEDVAVDIGNMVLNIQNLSASPDTLNNVKSNYLWLLSIQEDLKPVIEIYSADDYTLKSAYQRFCEFGIKLDKYVDEIELRKYLNFNTVYPHDKTEYKYINCDVKLYGYYTWFLKQQDILERELADGIFLVNKQAEIKDIPQADYDVIQSLKEEDFNFE